MSGPRRKRCFDKGRWQIEKERAHIVDRSPRSPYNVHTISEIIPDVMNKFGFKDRIWEKGLIDEWESLVGQQVAQHTRAGRLTNHVLYIFVSNSAWLSELERYGKQEILKKLQERFGTEKIRGIRLQLDPD